jgi:hypothetical protein
MAYSRSLREEPKRRKSGTALLRLIEADFHAGLDLNDPSFVNGNLHGTKLEALHLPRDDLEPILVWIDGNRRICGL